MYNLTNKQKEIIENSKNTKVVFKNNIFYKNGKVLNNRDNKPYLTLLRLDCFHITKEGNLTLNVGNPIVKNTLINKYKQVPKQLVLKKLTQKEMYNFYLNTFVNSETLNKEKELANFEFFNFKYVNLKNTDSYYLCLFFNNQLIGYIHYEWLRRVGYFVENEKGRLLCLLTLDIHKNFKGNNLSKILLANLNKYIPNNDFVYTEISNEGSLKNVEKNIKTLIRVPTIEYSKLDVSKYTLKSM